MGFQDVGLISLQLITFSVMLFGLFSLLVLIIPGLVIIWVAALVYTLVTGFNWLNITLLVFITLLMLVGNMLDNVFIGAGALKKGASWISLLVAIVLGIAGSILYPPLGGLIAALIGLFITEIIRMRDFAKAWDSMRGMMSGCGWAVVARFLVGVMMIVWWGIGIAAEWLNWV